MHGRTHGCNTKVMLLYIKCTDQLGIRHGGAQAAVIQADILVMARQSRQAGIPPMMYNKLRDPPLPATHLRLPLSSEKPMAATWKLAVGNTLFWVVMTTHPLAPAVEQLGCAFSGTVVDVLPVVPSLSFCSAALTTTDPEAGSCAAGMVRSAPVTLAAPAHPGTCHCQVMSWALLPCRRRDTLSGWLVLWGWLQAAPVHSRTMLPVGTAPWRGVTTNCWLALRVSRVTVTVKV